MTRQGSAGFTLLEVLVAVVVLGLLVGMLGQAMRTSLRFWNVQSGAIARRNDEAAVQRALRGLIEHMDPGAFDTPPTVNGGPHTLAFTTELPMAAASLRTRTADVALGVDAQHRLMLHWAPHLPGIQAGSLGSGTSELANNVERIEIAYWQDGQRSAWQQVWTGEALPGLVRIHFVFRTGDPRHWADLIGAPMRARPVVLLVPSGARQFA